MPLSTLKSLVNVTREDYQRVYITSLQRYENYAGDRVYEDELISPVLLSALGQRLAIMTLRLRQGCLLPQGSAIETIHHRDDHWTYAIFSAALWHFIAPFEDKALMLSLLLTAPVLSWLQRDTALFKLWLNSLMGGDRRISSQYNPIVQLIGQAKSQLMTP